MEYDSLTGLKESTLFASREIMDEHTALTPSVIVTQFSAKSEQPKRRNRGKWLRRGLFVLILLGVVGLSAPTVLSLTVLKRSVPKMLVPMLHANIDWSELSLGWLSPVVIKDLKIADLEGRPLLDVQKISTDRPLWALAARSGGSDCQVFRR
jgi:hypothetical protein